MVSRRLIIFGAFVALPACTARNRYSDLDGKGASKLDRARLLLTQEPCSLQ